MRNRGRKRTGRTAWWLATALVWLVFGCRAGQSGKAPAKEEEAPINVRAERPQVRAMEEVIEASGNLEPISQVDVPAQVSGKIVALYAGEGEEAAAGQVLARVEDEEYRLSLRQAESALKVARSDYENAKALFEQGMKSRSELEKLGRSYEDARTNAELSRLRLDRTQIKSPLRGRVVSRNVELHQQVGAGEVLFTVADLSSFKVLITVTEAEVGKLQEGQLVRIRVEAVSPADRGYPFSGRVHKIKPKVEPKTGTVEVEVRFPNPGGGIKPGMFARLKIVTALRPQALVIPRQALQKEDGSHVWVVEGQGAKLAEVRTGLVDEEGVEVLSGLAPSDLVIVEGQSALTPRSKIKIVNGSSPAPAPGVSVEPGKP